MALVNGSQPYAHPGEEASDRAAKHRRDALDRAAAGEPANAILHALLAIESRIDEMTWTIATGS